jgi:Zinc finger, C2H2 type
MDDLHHPAPRLPPGWKQYHADNIDITTTSSGNAGRHSRSTSALSNHNFPGEPTIEPLQIQSHTNALQAGDSIYGRGGDPVLGRTEFLGDEDNNSTNQTGSFVFQSATGAASKTSSSSELRNNGYFQPPVQSTASQPSTATRSPILANALTPAPTLKRSQTPDPLATNTNVAAVFDTVDTDDFVYLPSSTAIDPTASSSSPFLNSRNSFAASTSPPLLHADTLSPFAPFHNSFDQQNAAFTTDTNNNTNTLGLNPTWTHHRSLSEQSDISSQASPFIGSVQSEHNSPYIEPQDSFEEDLQVALRELDMGAQFDLSSHYQTQGPTFDPSTLQLDQSGFPMDAPLFSSESRSENYYLGERTSRPGSSSSYHGLSFPQSIFQAGQPSTLQTAIPPAFQSPPLPSATSIPEIEVTAAPPTPRTQAFLNDSYFMGTGGGSPYGSRSNSPSLPQSYYPASELTPPLASRRRAVSETGARPMLPPSGVTNLTRRVSSGSHPYLQVNEHSPSASGRSTPSRGHRKSWSHAGNHAVGIPTAGSGHVSMTSRDVLELVKNEGPREAKNPKKFVCDFPGCGQRFTRNSNKTTHMLTHTNSRPHVCPHCRKDFTRQHDWKRHMVASPYTCFIVLELILSRNYMIRTRGSNVLEH